MRAVITVQNKTFTWVDYTQQMHEKINKEQQDQSFQKQLQQESMPIVNGKQIQLEYQKVDEEEEDVYIDKNSGTKKI